MSTLFRNCIVAVWRRDPTQLTFWNSIANSTLDYTFGLPITKIEIEQRYVLLRDTYEYTIAVNGLVEANEEIPNAQGFEDVEIYSGSPLYDSANGFIKNFKFKNQVDGKKIICISQDDQNP